MARRARRRLGLAQQRPRRLVRGRRDGGESKVADTRLRDDRPRTDAWPRTRSALRQPLPRGRPEREVAARAVPDRADPPEVERRVEIGEEVDAGRDVQEGLGPAAAVPDAPVLEVPDREAILGEVRAKLGHQRQVVPRSPVPTVDEYGDGERPCPDRRNEQFA